MIKRCIDEAGLFQRSRPYDGISLSYRIYLSPLFSYSIANGGMDA